VGCFVLVIGLVLVCVLVVLVVAGCCFGRVCLFAESGPCQRFFDACKVMVAGPNPALGSSKGEHGLREKHCQPVFGVPGLCFLKTPILEYTGTGKIFYSHESIIQDSRQMRIRGRKGEVKFHEEQV